MANPVPVVDDVAHMDMDNATETVTPTEDTTKKYKIHYKLL